MKTLRTAYRVTDLADSLDFYSALGYQEVGRIGDRELGGRFDDPAGGLPSVAL